MTPCQSLALLFAVAYFSSVGSAYGHGFGFEVLPAVPIGNHNATLSIFATPPTFDPSNKEYEMVLNLSDSKSQAVIEHVTYLVEVIKDGKTVFKDKFHDDLGNLYLKITQKDSNQVTVIGKQDKVGWMEKDDFNPLRLEGPIFTSAGLYTFNIQILTVDRDDNVLENPVTLNAAISLAEKTSYDVTTKNGDKKTLGITSYYDAVKDFQYFADLQTVSFSMPFDWSDNTLTQVNVVHQEIHVPKTFLEMIATDYDVFINGVPLADKSIQLDDYSEEENRVVHLVIARDQLFEIRNNIDQSMPNMAFSINPGKQVKLPLSTYAAAIYKIDLWWDPPTINANKDTTFYVDLTELYKIKKETSPILFDFVLTKDNEEIFRKNVQSQLNGPPKGTPIEYTFSKDQAGLITVSVQNIGGNKFAYNQFNIAVNPEEIPTRVFPIRLESMKNVGDALNSGQYYVDLTWFPSDLRINEDSEFVITIYDKTTGQPVPEAEYDFVLLNGNQEILRKGGYAKAGGSFENHVFSENDLGLMTLRIENIDESLEFVEIPLSVTPEFPVGSLIVFFIVFSSMFLFFRFMVNKNQGKVLQFS
ncbi:MAG: hypothetical protein HYZ56_02700 [Nitrosopumilales archaeon]|nr:hypothetical protein [Nitrosopumilales archaeon]